MALNNNSNASPTNSSGNRVQNSYSSSYEPAIGFLNLMGLNPAGNQQQEGKVMLLASNSEHQATYDYLMSASPDDQANALAEIKMGWTLVFRSAKATEIKRDKPRYSFLSK
jgi:hypothetical protein